MFFVSMSGLLTLGWLFLMLAVSGHSVAQTREQAQHRLPPVIYALDIPHNRIVSGQNTTISWSLMGYHDDYEVSLLLEDADGEWLYNGLHTPYREIPGAYTYYDIRSTEFHYRATVNIDFVENQDITVRFFGVPPFDPIENMSFVSVIVPGGHPYRYADSSGRQILINGIADESDDIEPFLRLYDTVCGLDMAHFTAHYRDPPGRATWWVNFSVPPGVFIDFMAPTPNSDFDETLGHISQLFGLALPGGFIGTLWNALIFGSSFFDNEYLEERTLSHVTGRLPTELIPSTISRSLPARVPERKVNIRLRGNPPENDWYLAVQVTELKLSNRRSWGPVRVPLRCFGGPSDNG